MKTKRNLWKPLVVISAVILFCIFIEWAGLTVMRLNAMYGVENLNLPKDYETIYPAKAWISDVYWLHVKGEKVIKCNIGYEAVKEYIETHNSEKTLQYIDVYPYGGMSDIAIYDSQVDDEFWEQPDRDNYITISYFRKLCSLVWS